MSFKLFPLQPAPPDKLRNQFAAGKLGQAANPVVSFKHNKRSLQKNIEQRKTVSE